MAELTLEQLNCLASPPRSRVFSTLRAVGSASASEVASHLDRSAESVAYHLHQLASAGLVEAVEVRPTKRRPEAIYRATIQRAELPTSPEASKAVRKTVAAGLRQSARDFEAAAVHGHENIFVQRGQVRLSKDVIAEVSRMFDTAIAFATENASEDGVLVGYSTLICPIGRKLEPASGD